MKKEVIHIFHGCCQRKKQQILNRLDFSACEGEVLGVVSLNNDELDALCNVLTGTWGLSSGTFSYRGKTLTLAGYSEAMSIGIYGIHRQAAIVAGEDVASNVYLIPAGGGKPLCCRKELRELRKVPVVAPTRFLIRRQRAWAAVREFFVAWGIEIDVQEQAERLTRAQQLCVEVARAVLGGARLIVMNRIGNYCKMDPGFLQDIFRRLRDLGITVVFADNQLHPLMELSDRIFVMKKGTGEGVFEKGELTKENLSFLLADRSVKETYVRRQRTCGECLLTWKLALQGENKERLSVDVHAGEIIGITDMSERAAGSVLRLLAGSGWGRDGGFWMEGQRLELHSIEDGIKQGVCVIDGRVPNFGLIPNENLAVNLNYQRLNRFYPFSKAGAGTLLRISFEEQAEEIGCQKEDYLKYPEQISAIQQLRLYLVRARRLRAKILILISPSTHLDFVSRQQMCALIDQCAAEGMAILLLSLNTSVISDLCDRLLLIQGGNGSWVGRDMIREDFLLTRIRGRLGESKNNIENLKNLPLI